MRAFWTPTGLRVSYDGEMFVVEDLNPEKVIRNRLFRDEVFWMSLKLVWASIFARKPQ